MIDTGKRSRSKLKEIVDGNLSQYREKTIQVFYKIYKCPHGLEGFFYHTVLLKNIQVLRLIG